MESNPIFYLFYVGNHSFGLLRYPPTMTSGTQRENPVAIAHLHTTLNKSRDEKLIVRAKTCPSPIGRDQHLKIDWSKPSFQMDTELAQGSIPPCTSGGVDSGGINAALRLDSKCFVAS